MTNVVRSLFLFLVVISLPALASSQDNVSMTDRLAELEREIGELQERLSQLSNVETEQTATQYNDNAVPLYQGPLFDQMLTQAQLAVRKAVEENTPPFSLNGYARSGFSLHDDMDVLEGVGPYITPVGPIGGSVGRLGLESDTYVELNVANNFKSDDSSWGRFVMSIADGVNSNNDWTGNENGINIRQAYGELGNAHSFRDSAFKDAVFWAGKRFDKNNFDIHFIDSNIIFLAGTGVGFYNARVTNDWSTSLSVYLRDIKNALDENILTTIVSSNNYIGNWQIMLNQMNAKDNNAGAPNRATSGQNALVSYSISDFFGFTQGASKIGFQLGNGLGAELKQLGAQEQLQTEAKAFRFFLYGVTSVTQGWQFAPSIVTHWGENTFAQNDDFYWSTINFRAAQQIADNVIIQYETSYQYMDIQRTEQQHSGNFLKFTIAPTLKLDPAEGFFSRPELRIFATWMKWDKNLNTLSLFESDSTTFGATGFSGDKKWLVGAQMEVWY